MKIVKKLSLILFAIIVLVVQLPISTVKAVEKKTGEELFKAASDETVVCYYMGVPIKKNQINKDRTINQAVVNSISKCTNSTNSITKGADTVVLTLPTKYNEAVVYQTITAPGYSQKDTVMYLTNGSGEVFASKVSNIYADTTISLGLGWILRNSPYAQAIGLYIAVGLAAKGELANNIRKITDSGYKIKITSSTSQYGTFYGYEKWVDSKIQYTTYNNNGNKMVLDSIYYQAK